MKVSAWASVSDLVVVKKTFLEKAIHFLLKDEKSKMYATQPLSQILPALKKSGVDGIELLIQFHTSDENIKEIKKIVDKYKIPVLSLHQSLNSFNNVSLIEIERLCKSAEIIKSNITL